MRHLWQIVTLALLGAQVGLSAETHPHHSQWQQSQPGKTRLFPFLTKLRDGIIESFFGQHPSKEAVEPRNSLDFLRNRYANELVLRFNISTKTEESTLTEVATRLYLDIWAVSNNFVDIRLHTDEVAPLLELLPKSLETSYSTLISDLATAVYNSLPATSRSTISQGSGRSWSPATALSSDDNLFFQDYQSLPVIIRWMRLLEAMFPSHVKYISIGNSYEGREIPALRVGVTTPPDNGEPRKTLVVTGGLHAREWISTSTVNYVAWSFITSFGKDTMITKFLNHFDVVFMPIVNPDGVEYSWQVDRLWRKSRQQTSFRFCRGLDLDHTFGFGWGGASAQMDPCSEGYGGEQPFQAVEALELATWARNMSMNDVKFVGLLDLHSYSQQILFPYSYSCSVEPPNLENLEELAAGIAKAIRLSNGQTYTVTSACEGTVTASNGNRSDAVTRGETGGGSAIDWFYHEMRAHFSYQIKLRDTGSYGFLLPKEQIIPTGEEIFDAMKYIGDYLLGNNGIERIDSLVNGENTVEGNMDVAYDDISGMELRRRRARR